jgi:photosystem II stability/assembly factor-like uncharacterized protein
MFARSRISLLLIISICFFAASAASQFRPQGIDPSQLQRLRGNKQFERWLWEYQQRAYPLDHIPEKAKHRAFQLTQQAKAAAALTQQAFASSEWENLGPKPIVNGPTPTGFSPAAGRVADVAVDPIDANHWLIAAAQGGIWETLDGGFTWSPRINDQPTQAMGAIAFAPSNRDIVYAGTGEAVFSGDAYGGAGVLKSTDRGASWHLLATSTFSRLSFSDIKVAPTTPNVVMAAVARNGASGSTGQPGIYKSTDGGVSWSRKLQGVATDLEADPMFSLQYAGIGEPFPQAGGPQNGLYRSFDGGETWSIVSGPWSNLAGGVGRVELALSPSNPEVLYISIQDAFNTPGQPSDLELLGVWRTSNASSPTPTWTALPVSGAFSHRQWWYDHDMVVDPSDQNTLYLGGLVLSRFDGFNWTTISEAIHVDQQSLAWAGNRLISGNDGGVWSTTNAGSTWTNHNAELSITQFYLGSLHPTGINFALGGTQDNGTLRWSGSPAWEFRFEGDGAANAISSVNPNTHWAVSAQLLDIRRTTDAGQSFDGAGAGIDRRGAPFIAEFEKCPNNDNLFIAGTDNLWRTNNFFLAGSPAWVRNGPEMGASIVSMAFAPSDPSCNTYCYATDVGQIMLTTDGGVNWRDIDPANSVPNRFITDLAFDPTNRNILYLTLSGFDEGTPAQPGHIFKTTSSLAASPTWSNISTPVNIPHNALVVDPSAPNNVFVGTDLSIWNSTNGGITWTITGTGLPSVAVFDLQINPSAGKLVAFTHGRGAFAIALQDMLSGPSGLVATAISNARVDITWTAPSGPVHHYELDRKQSISAPFIKLADIPPSTTSFTDLSVSNSVAYLYQVRAVGSSGNSSQPSNMDLATTMSFTDNPLMAGATVIKAQHIDELRAAVNAVRAAAGLPLASWTDASLPGVIVKAIHITEPREKLNQALEVMGLAIPLYTDQPLIPGVIVKRVHVEEVRQTVR